MSIKVNLQDGMVGVGGDFNLALAWVKGWAGRSYEGATKAADEAEREAIAPFAEKFSELDSELRVRAEAIGLHSRVIEMFIGCDFLDNVEMGIVQFSSPARKQEVMVLYDWYRDSWIAISRAEENAAWEARESFLNAYDIE